MSRGGRRELETATVVPLHAKAEDLPAYRGKCKEVDEFFKLRCQRGKHPDNTHYVDTGDGFSYRWVTPSNRKTR